MEWLKKDYGPFKGREWLIVIVGGVGLGIAIRLYMGRRGEDAEYDEVAAATGGEGFGVSTGVDPTTGGGSLYNQGEIVSAVLEAIEAQKKAPTTTDPTDTGGGGGDGGGGGGGGSDTERLPVDKYTEEPQYDPNWVTPRQTAEDKD